ncbi:helix-turn-helix domain-containing protein [Roseateles sp.]|uniref:IclR family transcriptional regulator n=1 Tax=Roseateles sp. TaxID=1971397 RepID=UPI0025ED0B69|nr:helix-turn-helix domain-containing protein [Roseateles sp.]
MATRWRSTVDGWHASKGDIVAVHQVFALLGAVADQGEGGAQQLAAKTALPTHTAQRLLHAIARLGYLRESGGGWRLTPRVFELGARALPQPDVVALARPAMRELARSSGEAVTLGLRDADDIVYVQKVESHGATGVCIPVGSREPLQRSFLGAGGPTCHVRRLPHLCSLGMPFFDHDGQVVGGLVMHVPAGRADAARVGELAAGLQAATATISSGLGHMPQQACSAPAPLPFLPKLDE